MITLKKRNKLPKLFLGICLLFFLSVRCNKNKSDQEFENGLVEFEKYFSKKELNTFKNDYEGTAFITIKDGKNKSYESFFRHFRCPCLFSQCHLAQEIHFFGTCF